MINGFITNKARELLDEGYGTTYVIYKYLNTLHN